MAVVVLVISQKNIYPRLTPTSYLNPLRHRLCYHALL